MPRPREQRILSDFGNGQEAALFHVVKTCAFLPEGPPGRSVRCQRNSWPYQDSYPQSTAKHLQALMCVSQAAVTVTDRHSRPERLTWDAFSPKASYVCLLRKNATHMETDLASQLTDRFRKRKMDLSFHSMFWNRDLYFSIYIGRFSGLKDVYM